MKTALYRHFDADGNLLYIGIALSTSRRLEQHMKDSEWAAQIATIKIEYFPTRDEAIAAERAAIIAEHPIWNVIHNRAIVLEALSNKLPEQTYPTEIGDVVCFEGSYSLINGQLIQDATGLRMHADQAKVRQGSLSASGRITYFD